jgi:hypothetical protein
MLTAALIALAAGPTVEPVELVRTFTQGESYTYEVRSFLQLETKEYPLAYYLPSLVDLNYDFTAKVNKVRPSGFAEIYYERPEMIQIDGETAERGPLTTKEKIDWKINLVLSPINEIIEMEDLTPKKDDGGTTPLFFNSVETAAPQGGGMDIIGEIQRLALFIGSLDSAIDFSPKLPFDEVEPGDTWERTASYQPQKTRSGKTEVQRLDYVFTFDGVKDWKGIKIYQITSKLELDSDAAPWLNRLMRVPEGRETLMKMPLKLEAKIIYRLDMETKRTLSAFAESNGGWEMFMRGDGLKATVSQKIKGRTTLKEKAK